MNNESRDNTADFDAIIVGAGLCGIYMLYKLLQQGLRVMVVDRADEPGGTWYWNRYPGARFDSESYTYGYSFSDALLQEWDWSEHFAAQPETLRYLNHVVEHFDLREHMQFGLSVERADYNEADSLWAVTLDDGRSLSCRYLLTAVGMLSAATLPNISGGEEFHGKSFHTYYWPKEPVDLKGKRVAVIGTGATGVQIIGAIAPEVGQLTVFQRRPNWCAPLHNSPIDAEEMARIKESYADIFARCRATPNGFLHAPDRRVIADLSEAERHAFWDELYNSPGFGVWLGNFRDVLVDPASNAEFSAYMVGKISERVHDPVTAEKLTPQDHGFGTRRVPMETNYYEAYNYDHVRLVDLNDTPIERITPTGIATTAEELEFDIIVYATGFDAITGAYDRVDITGRRGQKLADKWRDGPITYMGTGVHGFPNLFTLTGPQGASVSTNFPPVIETAVEWTAAFIDYLERHGHRRAEVTEAAEQSWLAHVKNGYDHSLLAQTKSWFTGYNSNVAGHDKLRYMVYLGGAPAYREKLAEVADAIYEGYELT